MRVLLDHSAPSPLRRFLPQHEITEAAAVGWERLGNGELLAKAELEGFQVFITADKNLRYQQSLTGRKIAVVILGQGQWPAILPYVERVQAAVNEAKPGSFLEVEIPYSHPKGHRTAEA